MEAMRIPFIPELADAPAEGCGELLRARGSVSFISISPWPQQPSASEAATSVEFHVGYHDSRIAILYDVRQPQIRAQCTRINDRVCEDSCVEFFISDAADREYVNFEFNARGTPLAGKGTCRDDRRLLSPDLIKTIDIWASFTGKASSPIPDPAAPLTNQRCLMRWQLVAVIDLSLFGIIEKSKGLMGKKLRGNFFSCGDKLKRPYYLVWNDIAASAPDFHRPECFGQLEFAER
jgi:hypothetical protein